MLLLLLLPPSAGHVCPVASAAPLQSPWSGRGTLNAGRVRRCASSRGCPSGSRTRPAAEATLTQNPCNSWGKGSRDGGGVFLGVPCCMAVPT